MFHRLAIWGLLVQVVFGLVDRIWVWQFIATRVHVNTTLEKRKEKYLRRETQSS